MLTKRAGDIPFDLKHRPHIVYGGEIQKLRAELGKRLVWAIEESRRRGRQSGTAAGLTVHFAGQLVPEMTAGEPAPEIGFSLAPGHEPTDQLDTILDVRNDGLETSEAISHLYMFTTSDSGLIPSPRGWREYGREYGAVVTITPRGSILHDRPSLVESVASRADQERLGLALQYRLDGSLPPIPPGAVEPVRVSFKLQGGRVSTAKLCLRLHTSAGARDFPFTLYVRRLPGALSTPPNPDYS